MMKTMLKLSLAMIPFFISQTLFASDSCRTVRIEMEDNVTHERGQMIVACTDGIRTIPDRNTLVFTTWKDHALCTVVKECSNIRSWNATIGIKGKIEYKSTLATIDDHIKITGTLVPEIKLSMSFGEIDSYCSEMRRTCHDI